MIKLFCYGTLKRGFNNHWYLQNSEYLGATTVNNFKLVESGIPFMVPQLDAKVFGEVYEVDYRDVEGVFMLEGGYTFQPVGMYDGEVIYGFTMPDLDRKGWPMDDSPIVDGAYKFKLGDIYD